MAASCATECARPSTQLTIVLLLPLPHALADPCTVKVCGLHASCVKDVGQPATCVCDGGFAMTPDQGCVDTCTLKACVDGTCSKLENGTAVCSCDAEAGFKLQLDKRTCKYVCVIADCETKDANSECERNRDEAHCKCKLNFELFQGVCTGTLPRLHFVSASLCASACLLFVVLSTFLRSLKLPSADSPPPLLAHPLRPSAPALPDTCVVKDCVGGGGTCTQDADGVAFCHCDAVAGLKLQDDGRTCKDTCVVKDCVGGGGTCTHEVNGTATCHCDAEAGLVLQDDGRTCKDTCVVKDCVGGGGTCTHEVNGTATCHCDGDAGLVLLDDKRTCKDTCVVKGCGVNGKCQKEITTGVASCVCDLGFTLQADGTTCKDNCEILSCSGPKEHCAKSATTGEAYCKCDDYFHRAAGGFCQELQHLRLHVREEGGRDSVLHLQPGCPAEYQALRWQGTFSIAVRSICSGNGTPSSLLECLNKGG
ncbi:unnamed protein product [Closterium sp. NIES-65]|nr:unnamed protein product [Closterium sp. NIES-65]